MADISLQDRQDIEALPESDIFSGLCFSILGPLNGVTAGALKKTIKKHGGKISDKIRGNVEVSYVILSGGLCKLSLSQE